MDFNKKIGKTISEIRKKNNKTLEKLAYESDFSKGGLSEIERGLREIKLSSLVKLCKTLDLNLSEFFQYYEQNNK